MAKGAAELKRERSRVARGRSRTVARRILLTLPILLLLVTSARGEVAYGLSDEPDQDGTRLTWRDAVLEWGAGTAVGTGVGMLRYNVAVISIPCTNTPVDLAIGLVNNFIIPIAISTPFSCAAGCDAVGLALQSDGVLWHGFTVGSIVAIAGAPLGELVHDRTGSSILRSLVPAAIGSAGAVIGYNYELLFPGNNDAEIPSVGSLDAQFRWQSFRAEAPCGTALSAAGGLILPRWLHARADSTGRLPAGGALSNGLMDIFLTYPLPCVLGIDACALAMGREYNFWSGYIGAALGTAAVIGVGALAGYGKQLDANALARLLPAVAAGVVGTIGFNAIDFEGDFLTSQQRFMGPALAYVGPDYSGGGTCVDFDVRLVTVRF